MKLLASTKVVVVIVDVVPVDVEAVVGVPVRVRDIAISVAYCLISSISPEIFSKISCVPPAQTGFLMRHHLNKTRQAVSLMEAAREVSFVAKFKNFEIETKKFIRHSHYYVE